MLKGMELIVAVVMYYTSYISGDETNKRGIDECVMGVDVRQRGECQDID